MRSISTKFVSGVGFSNGWALLALKKPPPLVPSSLIASCDATGPRRRICLAPSSVVTVVVGREVLDHALRDEDEREDDADAAGARRRCRAIEVDPEVAERLRAVGPGRRVSPRASASATPMPAAAEMKLCHASPAICVR